MMMMNPSGSRCSGFDLIFFLMGQSRHHHRVALSDTC